MSNDNDEIWRDVPGYEGMYMISTFGNICSVSRKNVYFDRKRKACVTRMVGGKLVKKRIGKTGYISVSLHKDGKRKIFFVHRLVAMVFIDNPFNCKYVNHIDENKSNNHVENLEWIDFKQNVDYSQARIIARVSESGKIEKVYNSINDVREDGYQPSTIIHILNKTRKLKTHKGKRWIEIDRRVL